MRNDPEVELAAMAWAMEFEREAGWEPEDVSDERDGRGFDIRSVRRDEHGRVQRGAPDRGQGSLGRSGVDVSPLPHRVDRGARHGETFWLYVVYGATGERPRGVRDPGPGRPARF